MRTPVSSPHPLPSLRRLAHWALLAGCAGAPAQPDAPKQPAASASAASASATSASAAATPASPGAADAKPAVASAPALPDVERARLEYALASTELLAQDWPWLRADQTCVLLIALEAQWIVNCPSASDRFQVVPPEFRGRPVYAHTGNTVLANGQSIPTSALVRMVPALADVSLPDMAEPEGKPPWIITSSLDAMIGSHPAFGPDTPTEEWLAIFIHEFFHTRQLIQPSFHGALAEMKSGKIVSEPLEKLYREDGEYRAQIESEFQLLSSAAAREEQLGSQEARDTLARWWKAYEQRRAGLHSRGELLARSDLMLTYVEGTARYAEAMFVREARFHAATTLPADTRFGAFQSFGAKQGYEGLIQRKLGARYFYTLGMHLGLLLDRIDPTWKARVSEHPEWLIGLAREVVAPASKSPRKRKA